jgi:DNA-binding XRE family transcriptional regulator
LGDITEQFMGLALRQKRRDALITQAELAVKLGVKPVTVNHWERGRKRPSLQHVKALQELFKTQESGDTSYE